jgi:hypothetical protein
MKPALTAGRTSTNRLTNYIIAIPGSLSGQVARCRAPADAERELIRR